MVWGGGGGGDGVGGDDSMRVGWLRTVSENSQWEWVGEAGTERALDRYTSSGGGEGETCVVGERVCC